ncbi:MAG: S8 family serine peptidase [Ignavibacteriales bacterium]|nr:S8 family serine peptidase [Ignavibacteriales bacterium]
MKNVYKYFASVLVAGSISYMTGCNNGGQNLSTTPTVQQENNQEKIAVPGSRPEYVSGEILVKFASGVSTSKLNAALSMVNGTIAEKVVTEAMKSSGDNEGIAIVKTSMDVFTAINALKGSSEVVYAEPNYYYYHDATSNDTYYTNGSLWGMYGDATSPANQYGSQAGEAWAAGNTGSNTVYVATIDEGAQWAHEDLAANMWSNPYDAVDGIDNDGNGYKDDTRGWDFDKNDNTTYDGTQDDHGTHVSGTIGGVGGNAKGVAGVVWSVKMITLKFLGRAGGTTANAIKAVDYATDLKTRHGLNIVATNNSWGGGGFSQALKDAIDRANAANILFCAAAGNDGLSNDATLRYPSSYTSANVIAVASITSTGAISSFSNYGATTVDIGAPGSAINSTLPNNAGNKYGSYSGTSMATPHVTGAVALYASTHPGSTAAQIKSAIMSSAVATSSLSGKCVTGGRLNVSGF